jgi:hypothetical protein
MDANEYLEKIVAENYKREIDQEENVVRSLPFVAASLAVLATIISFSRSYVPDYTFDVYTSIVYVLILGFGISIVAVIGFLFLAVVPRAFHYLARPDDLQNYAAGLRTYYEQQPDITPENIEKGIVYDVRQTMIDQYVNGAINNQAINVSRSSARARAFTALVAALGFAFLALGTISVHEVVKGYDRATPTPKAASPTKTGATSDADRYQRGMDLQG